MAVFCLRKRSMWSEWIVPNREDSPRKKSDGLRIRFDMEKPPNPALLYHARGSNRRLERCLWYLNNSRFNYGTVKLW